MLHSKVVSNMDIVKKLLGSSNSLQVGLQGLLVRAKALLCLSPHDFNLRVQVHLYHLESSLSLPACGKQITSKFTIFSK